MHLIFELRFRQVSSLSSLDLNDVEIVWTWKGTNVPPSPPGSKSFSEIVSTSHIKLTKI